MAEVILSNRMQALTDMVTPGTVITDVGCDHGFVSVYLVQKGLSPRVIAICAGMGGPLMEKILTEGREQAQGFAELILQPQSEIPHFRTFLMDEGYLLLDENIIYEEGKYYFMMKVRWLGAMTDDVVRQKVGDSWKTEGLDPGLAEKFGPLLLSRRDRILREYLEWMLTERRQIVGRMEQKADADNPRTICRRQEIADEITLITRALDWYDNGKEADCI